MTSSDFKMRERMIQFSAGLKSENCNSANVSEFKSDFQIQIFKI